MSSSNNTTSSTATNEVRAYVATSATTPLAPGAIYRRNIRDTDVSIKIHYCGICHSDVHIYKNEWGITQYPVVPGHEIVGVVEAIGSKVTKFRVGQAVGIGCIVDSCQRCDHCQEGEEHVCREGMTMTYSYPDKISGGFTYGGYSDRIVVEDRYVVSIPEGLSLAEAAPLLCAGITVWTPMQLAGVTAGTRVGIVGIGGLGHVAVKLARALDAHVVAFTSKAAKRDELLSLGADEVVASSDADAVQKIQNSLDLVIDTVSDVHDLTPYLDSLKFRATYHVLGAASPTISMWPLLMKQIKVTGSGCGSIRSTQEMLDLCAQKKIGAQIELVPLADVNAAYERLEKGDIRYRFVLDIKGAFSN